jgi:hypothetical protein
MLDNHFSRDRDEAGPNIGAMSLHLAASKHTPRFAIVRSGKVFLRVKTIRLVRATVTPAQYEQALDAAMRHSRSLGFCEGGVRGPYLYMAHRKKSVTLT